MLHLPREHRGNECTEPEHRPGPHGPTLSGRASGQVPRPSRQHSVDASDTPQFVQDAEPGTHGAGDRVFGGDDQYRAAGFRALIPSVDAQSVRIVFAGSMSVARRAGTSDAASTTRNNPLSTAPTVNGSNGVTA